MKTQNDLKKIMHSLISLKQEQVLVKNFKGSRKTDREIKKINLIYIYYNSFEKTNDIRSSLIAQREYVVNKIKSIEDSAPVQSNFEKIDEFKVAKKRHLVKCKHSRLKKQLGNIEYLLY